MGTGAQDRSMRNPQQSIVDQIARMLGRQNAAGLATLIAQLAYTEGVFTPALAFGGASTGITYASRSGRYTRVGRLYIFDLAFTLTSKGSATGVATVGGLPATAAATFLPVCALVGNSYTAVTAPRGVVGPGTTAVTLFDFAGATSVLMDDTNFQNATTCNLSGIFAV